MSNFLIIRSSANGERSVSNRLIDGFVAELKANQPEVSIVERDLDTDGAAHITSATLAGIGRPAPETEAAKPTRVISDTLIAELQAADVLVLGAPLYNFGIPSTLKSWFDHVLRAGTTFQYTANGPEGLLKGKKALIVAARGGIYSDGPMAAMDYATPHLKTLLGFIGIADVDVVAAEGLAFDPAKVDDIVAAAAAKLSDIAKVPATAA